MGAFSATPSISPFQQGKTEWWGKINGTTLITRVQKIQTQCCQCNLSNKHTPWWLLHIVSKIFWFLCDIFPCLHLQFSISIFPQVFLAALSFSYFSKALSGTIMKSSITQIERRFDLPSSTVGFIDGSFEMGNITPQYAENCSEKYETRHLVLILFIIFQVICWWLHL